MNKTSMTLALALASATLLATVPAQAAPAFVAEPASLRLPSSLGALGE